MITLLYRNPRLLFLVLGHVAALVATSITASLVVARPISKILRSSPTGAALF